MTPEIFNLKKTIAVADLTIQCYKSAGKLFALYSDNRFILESTMWNLYAAYEGQLSLIINARYEDCKDGDNEKVMGGV